MDNTVPLIIESTVDLAPGQQNWIEDREVPGEAYMKVMLSNHTDHVRRFKILVEEVKDPDHGKE